MTTIVWDEIGSRTFESGLDRGVLYLPDGSAVPWNGLTEVIEKTETESSAVFYDGMKISDLVTLGAFVGNIKAVTYPDQFDEIQGMGQITNGMLLGQQQPQVFHLCYRTRVGNDLDNEAGYKIHILYNVTAIAVDRTFSTVSDTPSVSAFEWDITAVPEEVPGFKPTAYISIDSRYIDPALMEEIETALYGNAEADGQIIPLSNFVNYLYFGEKWKIIDNGDGTWKAITPIEGLVEIDAVDPDLWTLHEANAVYLSDDLYLIEDEAV